MTTLSDRVLSAAELRALQTRSDARGATRLAIHLALLGGTGWLVAIASGWMVLPAVLALGLVQVALFAPAHETMHQTAFASRRANAIVGWLVSCPSLLNAQFYTSFHLAHHRHTQIAGQDPELDAPDPRDLHSYASRVVGVAYWSLRLRVIADCWRADLRRYPYVSAAAAPRVIRSVRAMSLLMGGGAIGAALLFGWPTPLLYWIGPQLLAQPILRAYLLAEHTGCTLDRNGLTNTRTTLTTAPVRLLMWNMPYHAEHHLFPSIPFHRLAEAHAAIRDRLGFVQPGYLRWNIALVKNLSRFAGESLRPGA
jgi:fatty acid desaturase